MTQPTLIQIIISVLKEPKVIIAAVVCMIAMDLSCYIVRYRKKSKPVKTKPVVAAAPAPAAEEAAADEDDGGDDEE